MNMNLMRRSILDIPSPYLFRTNDAVDSDALFIDLNENDLLHHPNVRSALNFTKQHVQQYGCVNTVHDKLIDKISNYTGVDNKNIMLVNGCDMGINCVVNCCDFNVAYLQNPTYRMYERQIKSLQSIHQIIYIDDELQENIEFEPNSLIFFCHPNQPTGTYYTNWIDYHSIIEKYLKRNQNSLIVIDETYIDFLILVKQYKSICKLITQHENLVVMRSMSKAFGLAGVCIGYIIAHEKLIEGFSKYFTHKCVTPIAKTLAYEVFNNIDWYEKQAYDMFENKAQIVDFMHKNGLTIIDTPCNFVVMKCEGEQLHKFLQNNNVFIRQINSTTYRISIPTNKTNCNILLNTLAKFFVLMQTDIWCICLNDRDDKYQWIKCELERHICDNIKFHRPMRDTRGGEFGCWESHKYCIKNSEKDFVMIFEDDAKFTKTKIQWMEIYRFMEESEFDTLFFGGTLMGIKRKTNSYVWNVLCNQAHAYIIKKQIGFRDDFCPELHQGGVDDYYRRYTNQYMINDYPCIQKQGFKTDNKWFVNDCFQQLFQHPNMYENFQIWGNRFATIIGFLPIKIQQAINPLALLLHINAIISVMAKELHFS